jgi:hypothetical protein
LPYVGFIYPTGVYVNSSVPFLTPLGHLLDSALLRFCDVLGEVLHPWVVALFVLYFGQKWPTLGA